MPFSKHQIPWNKGKKYHRRPNGQAISYYQKHRDVIVPRATKMRILRKEKMAGRPRPENCEVCHKPAKVFYDHDHKTNKFRGWLCRNCNSALGYAFDNPLILEALAKYSTKHWAKNELEKQGYKLLVGLSGKILGISPPLPIRTALLQSNK